MLAVFRLIAPALVLMGVGFSQANSRELQGTPSPPLDIYDPNPGPYFVFLDSDGELPPSQVDFIDHVIAAWSGSNLRGFSICFSQATGETVVGSSVKRSLRSVYDALKNRGAEIVVISASELCNRRSSAFSGEQSYVQIIGVVRGS